MDLCFGISALLVLYLRDVYRQTGSNFRARKSHEFPCNPHLRKRVVIFLGSGVDSCSDVTFHYLFWIKITEYLRECLESRVVHSLYWEICIADVMTKSVTTGVLSYVSPHTVADPEFPRHQPLILGQKPIIWQDFCRKLHENERNRTGGCTSLV